MDYVIKLIEEIYQSTDQDLKAQKEQGLKELLNTLTILNFSGQSLTGIVNNYENVPFIDDEKKERDINYALDTKGVQILAKALEGNTSVTALNLEGSEVGSEGAQALCVVLMNNSSLKSLSVASCKIGYKGLPFISDLILRTHSIEHLNLEDNNLTAQDMKMFSIALAANRSLKTLSLKSNELYEGVATIAYALKNTNIRDLNLSKTSISGPEIPSAIEALFKIKHLKTLNLSYNPLGEFGAKRLAEALKNNTSLKELNLAFCCLNQGEPIDGFGPVSTSSFTAIGSALKANHTLEVLNLFFNRMRFDDLKPICDALKDNRGLKSLNLGYNQPYIGFNLVSSALQANKTLRRLCLDRCTFMSIPTPELSKILNLNPQLLELDLQRQNLSPEKQEEILNTIRDVRQRSLPAGIIKLHEVWSTRRLIDSKLSSAVKYQNIAFAEACDTQAQPSIFAAPAQLLYNFGGYVKGAVWGQQADNATNEKQSNSVSKPGVG